MAAYGLAYLLMHDMLTHGRFGRMGMPRNAYLRRLVRAHRIHHARETRDGAVHFGFLWAPAE
jgi:beta-carotene 3-hydroxylase